MKYCSQQFTRYKAISEVPLTCFDNYLSVVVAGSNFTKGKNNPGNGGNQSF